MKILLINKYYHLKGGSEKYVFELENLLKKNGHQVRVFSMADEKNKKTADQQFFSSQLDFKKGDIIIKSKQFINVFYNREAVRQLKKLINEFQPDLAHLNNINFQLSTSIIDLLAKAKIPMIMTLHDYQLICPNHLLYAKDKYCQQCFGGKFHNCWKNKCWNDSAGFSFVAMLESYFNHFRKIYNKIDLFVSPSLFLKDKMVEFGFAEEKITVMPNFLEPKDYQDFITAQTEDYFLYSGRLAMAKGVMDLVKFFNEHLEYKLKIIGDGELFEKIKIMAKPNINLLGYKNSQEVKQLLAKARALIVPSRWPENCPYSVLEALAVKTPVIAKDFAGLKELITDKVNGFLYQDDNDLNNILKKFSQENIKKEMNDQINDFNNRCSSNSYYQGIINIYERLTKL